MPKERDLELKVGIFVVLAILCVVVFIFSIIDFAVFKGGSEYRVVLSFANGLKKNAPVRLAGVEVGHVRAIEVYPDEKTGRAMVAVDAWVEGGATVPVDSRFVINQLGLLGEKYLEIMPGESLELVRPGGTVRGEDPIPMEGIMQQVAGLGSKIETALQGFNEGVLSEQNKQSLSLILGNVADLTGKANAGKGTVGRLFNDPAVYENLSVTLANLTAVSAKMKNGEGTVGRFLVDESVFENLNDMTADLKENPWKLFYRPKQ